MVWEKNNFCIVVLWNSHFIWYDVEICWCDEPHFILSNHYSTERTPLRWFCRKKIKCRQMGQKDSGNSGWQRGKREIDRKEEPRPELLRFWEGRWTCMIWYNNSNNGHIERRNSRFWQSPHCATNCLQHLRWNGQGAIMCKSRAINRVLIMCNMLCATWYKGTAQLLSFTEFKSHLWWQPFWKTWP